MYYTKHSLTCLNINDEKSITPKLRTTRISVISYEENNI